MNGFNLTITAGAGAVTDDDLAHVREAFDAFLTGVGSFPGAVIDGSFTSTPKQLGPLHGPSPEPAKATEQTS